jgi:hypothetical protein
VPRRLAAESAGAAPVVSRKQVLTASRRSTNDPQLGLFKIECADIVAGQT